MLICLVTDRRRLGPELTTAAALARVVEQAHCAARAGVDLLQIRERDLEARDLATLVTDVINVTRGTPTRVVVNDRLDVALACGADGVHLRGNSIPLAAARSLAPDGFLIGRSVHHVDEVDGASAADYLIAGTVFESASKAVDRRLLGVEGLRSIVRRSEEAVKPRRLPVLAIGGVTEDHMQAIARTGAAGVAAIGLFTASDAAEIKNIVERVRSRFDTVRSGT